MLRIFFVDAPHCFNIGIMEGGWHLTYITLVVLGVFALMA